MRQQAYIPVRMRTIHDLCNFFSIHPQRLPARCTLNFQLVGLLSNGNVDRQLLTGEDNLLPSGDAHNTVETIRPDLE